MTKIIYVEFDGTTHELDVPPGVSLMAAAVRAGIPGIDGDCGGACACATCHVFVDPQWAAGPEAASEEEQAMLEFAAGAQETSRLSCQIMVHDGLDGLRLYMPKSQH